MMKLEYQVRKELHDLECMIEEYRDAVGATTDSSVSLTKLLMETKRDVLKWVLS